MKINLLAIIPARKNSVGIKNKHLITLNGKKVIEYTFINAKNSKYIDEILVSTDDLKIIKLSKKYNIKVPFIRPKNLSTSSSKMSDVVKHLLFWFKKYQGYLPKNFILLQPTSLFRSNKDIDKAIMKFNRKRSKSLVSISETVNNCNEIIDLKKNYFVFKKVELNRQNYKKSFFINGSIYIRNTKNFLQTSRLVAIKSHYIILNKLNSLELDNSFDLSLIKKLKN